MNIFCKTLGHKYGSINIRTKTQTNEDGTITNWHNFLIMCARCGDVIETTPEEFPEDEE